MPRDFYPRREAKIISFTSNFSARISAAAEDHGLTPLQASGYASVQQAFVQAYRTANDPGANSSSAYRAKEEARVALEAATRPLVGLIKANRAVTDTMRIKLGLKPQAQRRRRIPAPDAAPVLRIGRVNGAVIQVRLLDAASLRHGKPRDVRSAVILGHVGDTPPTRADDWKLKAMTSRTNATVKFESALPPGTKVWLTAYWSNARDERGPACAAVYTHLQYGIGLAGHLIARRAAAVAAAAA